MFKFLKAALLSLILLAAPLNARNETQKRLYDATVVLFAHPSYGEWLPFCSGSVIYQNTETTHVLTAAHCIVDERREFRYHAVYVGRWPYDGWKVKARPLLISNLTAGLDFAVIEFETVETLPVLKPAPAPLTIGTSIVAIGAPGGIAKLYLRGVIAAVNQDTNLWGGVAFAQLPDVGPGFSGGPVICGEDICGIVVGQLRTNPDIVAIEPISVLQVSE